MAAEDRGGAPGRCVVVGAGSPIAAAVAERLAAHGRDVEVVDPARSPLTDPATVHAAFEDVCGGGPLEAVVHVDVPAVATRPAALVELDPEGWDLRCEALVRSTLLVLQEAHRRLPDGGSIVVVLPTIALTGADGLSAWSAAAESQRIMAKVAARRWGARGINVHVVAVPPELFVAGERAGSSTSRSKAGPALPSEAASPGAAADLVHLVLRHEARALTGSTLVADGGQLMVP